MLSSIIANLTYSKRITSFNINGIGVSHLMFADSVSITFCANQKSYATILFALELLASLTNLRVNLEKSIFIFPSNVFYKLNT